MLQQSSVCLTHRLSPSSLQWQRNKGKSAELSLETYRNMIEKVGGCNAASPALRLRKAEFLLSDNEATGHFISKEEVEVRTTPP